MTLKLTGLAAVTAQLKEVSDDIATKALASAARTVFKRVADTAKQLVPRDSGDLREAIVVRVVKPKGGNGPLVVGIKVLATTGKSKQATIAAAAFGEGQTRRLPPARRWHFIELGTKNRAPTPFLRPALDMNAQSVIDDLSDELRKKIIAAVKKKSKGK